MNNIKLVDATQFKETEELINHINNVIKDDKKNMLVVRNINAISESEQNITLDFMKRFKKYVDFRLVLLAQPETKIHKYISSNS